MTSFCLQDPRTETIESPINDLIQRVLIENRGDATATHTSGIFGLQYRKNNELSLIAVIAYRKSLEDKLTYMGGLLDDVFTAFVGQYSAARAVPDNFEMQFLQLRSAAEDRFRTQRPAQASSRFEDSQRFKQQTSGLDNRPAKESSSSTVSPVSASRELAADGSELSLQERLARFAARGRPTAQSPKKIAPVAAEKPKRVKEARVWDPVLSKSSGGPASEEQEEISTEELSRMQKLVGKGVGDLKNFDDASDSDPSCPSCPSSPASTAAPVKASTGGILSFFKSLGTGTSISEDMLDPVLEKTRMHLIEKNVAAEVSQKLCNSIRDSLVGKSKGTFQGLQAIVKESLEKSLTQILTPGRHIDVLREARAARGRGTPYSMVFCGVNGVGKSTNLSKIAYWLVENKIRVLIAACDTFRAGAVEQLRTHVRKLKALYRNEQSPVELFEQGYGKDDAEIAQRAIAFGRAEGFDVVLIDTAGRMQDNEPLMRALAKLLQVNTPDLVLFVGDALAGNEASDQLFKFNQALAYVQQGSTKTRSIDGIVLTKFDTIDDKVGASISMTFQNGQPIVFVGTGQDYPDLKRLNVGAVVQSLMN